MTPRSQSREADQATEDAGEADAPGLRTGASPLYEALRSEILRGVHQPGSHLVEALIAQNYGVSRTPVRAALARLEGDGLIETIPNRGAFVSRWTDTDLEEIYALRVRLEPYASRLAAGNIAEQELDRLDKLAATMIELLDAGSFGWIERCTELNSELHAAILQASGSPRLISIVTALTELPLVRRAISRYPREMLRRNFDQHKQILQALRQGDGEWAEALMAAHILGARQALRPHGVNET
ncbi:MAG: GntR family transcriptional regulator [Rhizobiaceae bacterium]|nr:GntR family transcriptional regulator [Rhizobiaceae bacterium]